MHETTLWTEGLVNTGDVGIGDDVPVGEGIVTLSNLVNKTDIETDRGTVLWNGNLPDNGDVEMMDDVHMGRGVANLTPYDLLANVGGSMWNVFLAMMIVLYINMCHLHRLIMCLHYMQSGL